jgi:phosphoribosylaminoimidazole-succinocarboxamide synthase
MHVHTIQKCPVPDSVNPVQPTDLPGVTLLRRGKDKDVYDLGDMLLLASDDRLSAAGKSLGHTIAGKGKVVNQLSAYWFRKLRHVFPNHFVSTDSRCFPDSIGKHTDTLDGRSMLVWKTTALPVRCVVRGYLAGAGWREYQEKGEVCGVRLPGGMLESQRLPTPIFTPTAKGRPGGKNENIEFGSFQHLLGKALAEKLRDASIRLYFNAWKYARKQGVLIADTKFEFGFNGGELMLIDECLTPDTSRYWQLENHRCGGTVTSMDKQLLVDYLETLDSTDDVPHLPDSLCGSIKEKYNEVHRRIMG